MCPPLRIGALVSIASSFYSQISARYQRFSSRPPLRGLALSIHHIRALLERSGKALEGGVEHGAHQQRQHPALELVGQEESDIAIGLGSRLEGPAVFKVAERAFQILHHDLQIW